MTRLQDCHAGWAQGSRVYQAIHPRVSTKLGAVQFARGLTEDRAAVEAGLVLEWSNGQTEGQANKLKLLKRSMYGRANFDLLRRRVLQAS